MAMKLSTGKVAFPIEFDNGAKETIYINPNDPDLFVRFSNFEKRVEDKLKDIDDFELSADGTPNNEELIGKFESINKVICEELDIAFASNVSSIVFKYCSPFAIVGGEYFLIQFVQAIRPEIEKHNKKANAELQKKMAKHTDKYTK
jgi:hypothetical protein